MRRALIIPPDFTRAHSGAGELTVILHERLVGRTHVEIMPALGTHAPMTEAEREAMFPGIPGGIFRDHDFRAGTARLGEVPASFIRQVSGGRLDFSIACELNRLLLEGGWDRIFSIGQVVPHEVIGIANHNKNIHVGVGGLDMINKTHFLGAVHGMERIMGRDRSPVRDVLNHADAHIARDLPPVTYLLTVRAREEGRGLVTRGLFAGEGDACFLDAARLCRAVNMDLLDRPLKNALSGSTLPSSNRRGSATRPFTAHAWRWPTAGSSSCSDPASAASGRTRRSIA
ncbi:MAG: lactate racemase domain-containing protein [Minicystis sp.]